MAAHDNYEELRFTGLRQSEQIELLTTDCNLANGKITTARVREQHKNLTTMPPELIPT